MSPTASAGTQLAFKIHARTASSFGAERRRANAYSRGAKSISGRSPVRPFRYEVDLYQGIVRQACDAYASARGQTALRKEGAIDAVHRLIILLEAAQINPRHYDVFETETETGKDGFQI